MRETQWRHNKRRISIPDEAIQLQAFYPYISFGQFMTLTLAQVMDIENPERCFVVPDVILMSNRSINPGRTYAMLNFLG